MVKPDFGCFEFVYASDLALIWLNNVAYFNDFVIVLG